MILIRHYILYLVGDVSEMCNLSQGIEDRAYERGTANGLAEAVIRMHKKGYSIISLSKGI